MDLEHVRHQKNMFLERHREELKKEKEQVALLKAELDKIKCQPQEPVTGKVTTRDYHLEDALSTNRFFFLGLQ